MPSSDPRIQITRTPRVQRILDAGRRVHPDLPASEVLIRLAEERVAEIESEQSTINPLQGLIIVSGDGPVVTRQDVEDAIDEVD